MAAARFLLLFCAIGVSMIQIGSCFLEDQPLDDLSTYELYKRSRPLILPYRFWPMYIKHGLENERFGVKTRTQPFRVDHYYQKRAPGVVENNEYILREYNHLPNLINAG